MSVFDDVKKALSERYIDDYPGVRAEAARQISFHHERWLHALVAEIESLRSERDDLIGAIRRYGRHESKRPEFYAIRLSEKRDVEFDGVPEFMGWFNGNQVDGTLNQVWLVRGTFFMDRRTAEEKAAQIEQSTDFRTEVVVFKREEK